MTAAPKAAVKRPSETRNPAAAKRPRKSASPAGGARAKLIKAAAAELIARDGVLEVAAVAKRARVAVGLIYHYFQARAGLLAAVTAAFCDRWAEAMAQESEAEAARRPDFATRERRRLDRMVRFLYRDPLAPILLGKLAGDPPVAAAVDLHFAAWRAELAKAVDQARGRGELVMATGDTDFLLAFVEGGLRHALAQALAAPADARPDAKAPDAKAPDAKTLTERLWHCLAATLGVRQLSIF